MLPDRVYMYNEPEDTIVCFGSFEEEEKHIYQNYGTENERFYVSKQYCVESFESFIEIEDDELEDWKWIYDVRGQLIFKSLQDAKNLREQTILEKYFFIKINFIVIQSLLNRRDVMGNFVMIKIVNCKKCPHCETKLTKGYGYAMDYICSLAGKCIAGYCEWSSQEPQDGKIPDFCPLLPSDEKSYIGDGI